MPLPPKTDRYAAWTTPPETASPRLAWWEARISAGWQPNRRIRSLGYDEAADFFGVTIWEYVNVLYPHLYPVSP